MNSQSTGVLHKIETSFKLAMKGQEDTKVVIWHWGFLMYLLAYFLVDTMVLKIDSRAFDIAASSLMIIYFSWHIYVLRKCAPKKPKLTKEEKERLKLERKKGRNARIMRKLLLQEPFGEWNPVMIATVVDLCFVTTFLFYI